LNGETGRKGKQGGEPTAIFQEVVDKKSLNVDLDQGEQMWGLGKRRENKKRHFSFKILVLPFKRGGTWI